MANAKKCDRCGRFYDSYNEEKDEKKINSIIPANTDDKRKYWGHSVIELCPECLDEFNRWMNKAGEAGEFRKFTMRRFMRRD